MVNYDFAYGEQKMKAAEKQIDTLDTIFIVFMVLAIASTLFALLVLVTAVLRWIVDSLSVTAVLWLVTLIVYCRRRALEKEHANLREQQRDFYFTTLFGDEDGDLPDTVTVNGEEVDASLARAMVNDNYRNGVHRYSVAGDYAIVLGEGPAEIREALLDAADKHNDGVFRAVRGKKMF